MNHLNCRRPSIGIFKERLAAGLAASSELGIFFYLNKLTNKDGKCQRKVVFLTQAGWFWIVLVKKDLSKES
jgi:hypothetical protein